MIPLAVVLILLGLAVPLTLDWHHQRDANSASAVERAPVAHSVPAVATQPTLEPIRASADMLPDTPWALPPQHNGAQPRQVPAGTAGDSVSGRIAEALTAIHPSRAPPIGYAS